MNTQKFRQLEIDFEQSLDTQKFASKLRAYGFNEEQSNIIALKEKESDFDSLIIDLNTKVRNGKLKIENAVGYLIGVYKKKGILPIKDD